MKQIELKIVESEERNEMEKVEKMMKEIDKEVKDLENRISETNDNISSKLNSDEILIIIKILLFIGLVIFALVMISKARKV